MVKVMQLAFSIKGGGIYLRRKDDEGIFVIRVMKTLGKDRTGYC